MSEHYQALDKIIYITYFIQNPATKTYCNTAAFSLLISRENIFKMRSRIWSEAVCIKEINQVCIKSIVDVKW